MVVQWCPRMCTLAARLAARLATEAEPAERLIRALVDRAADDTLGK
jgi:hypothetical protein